MSNLLEEIDAYYEAKKSYTEMLKSVLATNTSEEQPEQDPIPQSEDDMQDGGSANLEEANAEIRELLDRLEASRIAEEPEEKAVAKK